MASSDKVIAIANNEIGYLEKASNKDLDSKTGNAGSGNYTKYWRDLDKSMQGQSWCNCFVNWCFVQAYGVTEAKRLLCTTGNWSYYTPTSAGYFKSKNQWFSAPQVGDIIYFRNTERIHHVGIVIAVSDIKVTTIEGNTSSGTAVIANGGEVAKKSYYITNKNIAGYGRPNYGTSTATNEWKKEGTSWYYYENGTKATKKWIKTDGYWYRVGNDGKMLTGYHLVTDSKTGTDRPCYFDETGKLLHESDDKRGFLEAWLDK